MSVCEQEVELFPLTREERAELRMSKTEIAVANLRKGTFARITENTKEIMELKEEIAELRKLMDRDSKPIKDMSILESTKRCQMIYV